VSGKQPANGGGKELRRSAESRLERGASATPAPGASATPAPGSGTSAAELLHELQVHQVELEMQNEELRLAQGALEETRDRYLELYDFAPVGYLTLDDGGKIASINLAGAGMLGVDRAALVSRSFERFVHPTEWSRWVNHLERVRERGAPQGCELILRPEGGVPFPAQLTSVGTASGVRCTLVDITERRRSEEERERRIVELVVLNQRLEQTQLQLLQADKMAAIGRLAAGVAHEINSPLAYAMSNLFLLDGYVAQLFGPPSGRDPGELRLDVTQSLTEAREGLERVSRVVSDLKSFAHPDTGRWQESDLQDVIEGALRVVASAVNSSIRFVRSYRPEAVRLRCRPAQLGQVFMSILLNAAQAGAPSGTITIRTGQDGSDAWVEIEDNGAGILPEHMNRLFEPFFTTKAAGVGTGLGLSIAYGIVRGHGGRIEVRSQAGAGSTFRVVLPVDGGGVDQGRDGAGPGSYVS
jgi:PAS domain S-box-containing protein